MAHRLTHRMLGPCCLCPLADKNKPDFVESAIFQATEGDFTGEYVAACASELKCGYIGKIELLLRIRLFTHCHIMNISPDGTTVPLPWIVDPALP